MFYSLLKKIKKYDCGCETIKSKHELELEKMVGQDRNERALNEISHPPHSTLPSCFNLPIVLM